MERYNKSHIYSFAVFYLKTLSRHAHRSIIKDYFFNCFSFWQIKNIYVNSALTSQFRYVCRMWVLSYCTTARSGYLFSCLISCLHGYKIGHEKRINKVLLTVRRYAAPVAVLARRALINNRC